MLQTWMLFFCLFKILSRYGLDVTQAWRRSDTYSRFPFRDSLDMLQIWMLFFCLFKTLSRDSPDVTQAWRRSDTHSRFPFRYSLEMLQIRTPFYCLFRFKLLKDNLEMLHPGCSSIVQSRYDPDSDDILLLMQYGYTPDMAVILPFIQTSAIRHRLDMLQTRKVFYFLFRFTYPPSFQMASISPFPTRFCHTSRWHL